MVILGKAIYFVRKKKIGKFKKAIYLETIIQANKLVLKKKISNIS